MLPERLSDRSVASEHCQRLPKAPKDFLMNFQKRVAECSTSGVKHNILALSFSLLLVFRTHH